MKKNITRMCNNSLVVQHATDPGSVHKSETHRSLASEVVPARSKSASIKGTTRWELIRRNLLEGTMFLKEQDKQLCMAGSLLDQYREKLNKLTATGFASRRQEVRLLHEIVSRGMLHIRAEEFRGTPMFDDGTTDPIKFHVSTDEQREVIEINRANLYGPALGSFLLSYTNEPPGQDITLESIREVLDLRSSNRRQNHLLESALQQVQERIDESRKSRSALLGLDKGATNFKNITNPNAQGKRGTCSWGRNFLNRFLPRSA